ncbi:response regulator receiver protein [Acidovorax delafieldii 2AN]|uniref:Response regulator receiver protein n=1 Tax=Acidovorax delafieldii 2AN TaxID=573060 RepID=C5T5J0_ACIDE|nr:response regulator [Acidovorax delafieldii]EER60266.1 response regulator receiver protein [Acidovorax delafieldii 2AN]
MVSPRVLLVEDDPAVRRFVALALDPLDIDLVPCATVAEARRAFDAQVPRLVLTDLTLPDGSGLDLLAWLQARGEAPATQCRTVVFSGAVDTAVAHRLQHLGVWRVLHKPASVGALVDCVAAALAHQETPAVAPPACSGPDPVAEFFGGNRALYEAYRRACLAQFSKDLAAGDRAVAAADAPALRLVAHNLKSVMALLGEGAAAEQARNAEEAAASAALQPMQNHWRQLRSLVQALVAT